MRDFKKAKKEEKIFNEFPFLSAYHPQETLMKFKLKKHEIYKKYKASYDKHLKGQSSEKLIETQQEIINVLLDEMSSFFALSLVFNDRANLAVKTVAKLRKKQSTPKPPEKHSPRPHLKIIK